MNKNFIQGYEFEDWQDLLRKIYLESLPLEYVKTVQIKFTNERVWELDIEGMSKNIPSDHIQDNISESLRDYEDEIHSIHVEIDLKRFKQDFADLT